MNTLLVFFDISFRCRKHPDRTTCSHQVQHGQYHFALEISEMLCPATRDHPTAAVLLLVTSRLIQFRLVWLRALY